MEVVEKKKPAEIVGSFILRFRKAFIVLVAALVVAVVAVIVIELATESHNNSVAGAMAEIDKAYAELQNPTGDKAEAQKQFDAVASKIDNSFKGTLAQQQALILQGSAKANDKNFADAEALFVKAYQSLKTSYLAPNALMDAAIAAESRNDVAKAKEYLTELATNFEKTSPLAIRAWFNVGRLQEKDQKWADAKTAYDAVVSKFSDSSWTKLARDRILYLKAKALI